MLSNAWEFQVTAINHDGVCFLGTDKGLRPGWAGPESRGFLGGRHREAAVHPAEKEGVIGLHNTLLPGRCLQSRGKQESQQEVFVFISAKNNHHNHHEKIFLFFHKGQKELLKTPFYKQEMDISLFSHHFWEKV